MVETRDSITKFCETATDAAKRYLRAHPEICILSADKGNRTVIMLREDYDRKMRALVEDTSTYKKLGADPTSGYQLRNNDIVKRLKNLKLIDHRTAYDLSSNNAICPRIYGQPKAHKPDLPLRPVIPNVTSPTYNLAKFVANILQSSIHSRYSTNSSFDFCGEVNGVKLPAGYIMISLDVTSLFTNVPRNLVIRNIIYRWDEIKTTINLDLFLEIVAYCMEASFFCFEGQYYKQTFGTAMGSPLSPIVADIVLDSVINTALSSLPFETTIFRKYVDDIFMVIPRGAEEQVLEAFNSVEPRLQFTIETEENGRLPFLDMTVIRNLDQTLTTEWYAKPIASGRMLNYTSFHQPKHKINVAKNFIHRVCSLTRNQPMEEIVKTIHRHLRINNYPKQLINRLINLYINRRQEPAQSQQIQLQTPNIARDPPIDPPSRPSCQPNPMSPPTLHINISQPTRSTRSQPSCRPPTQPAIMPAIPFPHTQPASTGHHQNTSYDIGEEDHFQYADPLANGHHDTRGPNIALAEQGNTIQTTPNQPEKIEKIYRSIPYVPALSERISKILAKDYPDVSIATKQQRTVNSLHSRVKFPVKQDEISNVIYKIPCNNCESSYVGMTRNNLRKRLAGHRSNINKLEKIMHDNNTNTDVAKATLIDTTTALIQHCVETDHRFDLDRTQILDHSYKPSILPFLEMCHITNTNHTVNKRTDIDRLSTTYAAVLHNIKSINERNNDRNENSNQSDNTSIGHMSHYVE